MAATLPVLVYNFNENNVSLIRDYSQNGLDGNTTSITIQNSARVGKEAVFNHVNDKIDAGNVTNLSGKADCAVHLAYNSTDLIGAYTVLSKTSQIYIGFNAATVGFYVNLFVATRTATVAYNSMLGGTYYDIDVVWESDVLTLYVDGVSVATDATQSGVIDTNGNSFVIGDDGAGASTYVINEVKVYDTGISTDIIAAMIAEQNGLLSDDGNAHNFAVGDIIGANIEDSPVYGIVTFDDGSTGFRFLPISENITTSELWQRCGNLFNTARQWMFVLDTSNYMCFYDNISLTTEVLTAAKKAYCMTPEGVLYNSSTKTTTYTTVSSDMRIYVDSSGGAFTITLDAAPTTNKEIEIIDSVGSCGANTVTINGGGNNIVGSATALMNSNYIGFRLIYNGTQWNLN